MPRFTSALALYDHQKTAFQRTQGTARQAWRQIPEGAYRDMKELTSGGISSRALARMGHPYARLGGVARGVSKGYLRRNGIKRAAGVAPLLPINQQTKRLSRSITLLHRSDRYTLEESVGFDAAKAGRSILAVQPKGTRYVVARGLWNEVYKRGRARNRAYNDVFFRDQRTAFSRP